MYAMQYEVVLPADYDMSIIRHRVATRGSTLDDRAGLGLKAYLVRERGVDESAVNEYAPFYLWTDVAAMGQFLWGMGGFGGIIASFGRPAVRHWAGAAFYPGEAADGTPVSATRRVRGIAPHVDPSSVVADAVDGARESALRPDVFAVAVAVDPTNWELVTLTLRTKGAHLADENTYQVLHLSRPELGRLDTR